MGTWREQTFGGLPGAFWTLWSGTLINRLGQFVLPFLGLYLTGARGMPVDMAGLIVSLYGLGSVGAGLVGGILADRLGRRATLLLGLFGGTGAMLALGFARSTAHIAVCTFLVSFVSDLVRPAGAAMIADIVPPEHRLRAYGLHWWAVNIGFSIAPVLAGLVASWSYLALFLADAATTFVYALVVLVRLPETGTRSGGGWLSLGSVVRDRPFLGFVAAGFVVSAIFSQAHVTMPVDMVAHGHSSTTFGLVVAVNGVLIVLVSPSLTRALTPLPRFPVLAAAAAATGLGFGVYAVSQSVGWYAAGVVVWTVGEMLSTPVSAAVIADRAPADERGRYQGFVAMSWGLASFVGPMAGGLVYRRIGPAELWLGCVLAGALTALSYVWIARRLRTAPPS